MLLSELMQESQYNIDGECRNKSCLKGRGGNDVQLKTWKGKLLRIRITTRRVRSICLLGEHVAVEGEGWMVLAIDKYDYGIF